MWGDQGRFVYELRGPTQDILAGPLESGFIAILCKIILKYKDFTHPILKMFLKIAYDIKKYGKNLK